MMQWTVRLETTTSAGEVKTTELVTISRPAVVGTLAEVGLMLAETNTCSEPHLSAPGIAIIGGLCPRSLQRT